VDTKKTIGRNVNKLRLAANLTQEELCGRAEIDRSYLQRLEKGTSSPTLDVLVKLKNALSCTWLDLLNKID
jgi:transcriptional regulator with XRE-family HTH domain